MLTLLHSAMSELDAVNVMLMSIGQAPVNTLTVPGIKDVSFAQLTLHNTSRNVQSKGWWFNREYSFPLLPDSHGEIVFPQTALAVEPVDRNDDFVERARKFYDRERHTFDFTGRGPVLVDLITFLPFEELPQVARNYIATRAARLFQANNVGSQILYQFTKEEEELALAEIQRAQLRSTNTNAIAGARRNGIARR